VPLACRHISDVAATERLRDLSDYAEQLMTLHRAEQEERSQADVHSA
jgi:hypothetical protein